MQEPEQFDNTEPQVSAEETFAMLAEPSSAMVALIRWAGRRPSTQPPVPANPRPRAPRQTPAERQKGSRLNDRHIAKIVSDHEAGFSVTEIANRRQVSRSAIVKYLRLRGFRVGTSSSYRPDQINEFARLYLDEGLTQAQIGHAFTIGPDTVMRALATLGITAKDRGRNRSRRSAMLLST